MDLRNKRVIDVAMMGARMHYAVPHIFHDQEILGRFFTDTYLGNKPLLETFLSKLPHFLINKGIKKLLGRKCDHIPSEKVVSFDMFGLWFVWQQRKSKNLNLNNLYVQTATAFDRRVIRKLQQDPVAMYAFNIAAKELFEYSKNRGIVCILEQTCAPQKIQNELIKYEFEKWPDWQPEPELEILDSSFEEREQSEWRMADMIVGGSQFVIDGLVSSSVTKSKCVVVPYGVSLDNFNLSDKTSSQGRPLRVLFVGKVAIQKGVQYLLEAIRIINSKKIEVKIVGSISLSDKIIAEFSDLVHFTGFVPRTQMSDIYKWADVCVFPSICEGSATVTYEALASGIPVITTPNSGSLVVDGVDGYIIPVSDTEAIAAKLENYLRSPSLLADQQQAAASGRSRVGFDAYRDRLVKAVRKFTAIDT